MVKKDSSKTAKTKNKKKRQRFVGRKLLLMGSKAFRASRLPAVLVRKLDEAMASKMKIIVGEVPGPCRLFQDYLKRRRYTNVVIGHAKSIRYNTGKWKTKQYGKSVAEREKNMIEECDSAIIVWQDNSGVIAENLELLKRMGKPTFLYEYYTNTGNKKADWLDPERTYDPYYNWKEFMRKKKRAARRTSTNRSS